MLIQEMRNRSQGIVAKIIVGMIIVVFALFGFGSIQTFLVPTPEVASVNGEGIPEEEMLLSVERRRRIMIANNGVDPSDIDDDQLRKDVLEELVERELLNQLSDDLGLYYSDEKIDSDILATQAFQVDGRFDPQQFQLVIRSVGYSPSTYRELLRAESKYRQITSNLTESSFVTPQDVERIAELNGQTRDVAYMIIQADRDAIRAELDEAAIKAFHEEHADDYVLPEAVKLSYIELTREEVEAGVIYQADELLGFYEAEKNAYTKPEERRAAHILIEVNNEVTEDQAEQKINEIYERIVNGEDFGQLAGEFSQDPGSASLGGDLGFSSIGTYVPEFEKVWLELIPNEMSKPVLTEFGYHLIKMLEIHEEQLSSFEELQERLDKDYRRFKAEQEFVERSAKLSELAFEVLDLTEIAGRIGSEIKLTDWIEESSSTGIAASPKVKEAAFSADLLVDGNNSDLIEINPDHHVVLRVAEHREARRLGLEEVRAKIENSLIDEMARKQTTQRKEEALAMLRGGSITRFVADQFGSQWQVRSDLERSSPDVLRPIRDAAFKLPRPLEGQKSLGSVVLANGSAVVITVTRVNDSNSQQITDVEKQTFNRILAQASAEGLYRQFKAYLKEKADIDYK